ncbi:alpha/beta fold hydrolase [Actinomadura nitritigenes]|uniref:alpha/beta fold hydrolase n=1 Tax=Actinomadura nitritigenes TaxID=134602 RepID=UPI003D8E154F
MPTLVLHGARDGDNLPETSADKSALFTAEYERISLPDAGHFPPRETPDQVADLIFSHQGGGRGLPKALSGLQ